jgi:hypothetical protein
VRRFVLGLTRPVLGLAGGGAAESFGLDYGLVGGLDETLSREIASMVVENENLRTFTLTGTPLSAPRHTLPQE